MEFSSDEYFGTLGGSLMKDLLADLQVDDSDFSLDQLEIELAALDHEPSQLQHQPILGLDAASLVVSHAQQQRAPTGHIHTAPTVAPVSQAIQGSPGNQVDAWSLSLQNFAALALQEDFLAADSERKQQQQQRTAQLMEFEGAEDYDIGEKASYHAPPGLGGTKPASLPSTEPPKPFPFPKTPNAAAPNADNALKIKPKRPNFIPEATATATATCRGVEAVASATSRQGRMKASPPAFSSPQAQSQPLPVTGGYMAGLVPPGVALGMPMNSMMTPPMMYPQSGMPMAPPQHTMTPRGPQGQPVLMATPAARGPAWQAAPATPMPQTIQVYCNPHPAAPPIPGTALESKYMSARDIAYVVHSILKPVLAEGVTEDDYYIQLLRRLGAQANPDNRQNLKGVTDDIASRAIKAKEWSSEKGVLGYVTKSNVARPRALIATPVSAANNETDLEQKQRATLWKSRIYCDQAYQSYQTVVDIWRSAPPGAIPPQVQTHLVKLMKCMGITSIDREYQQDRSSLTLLLKLRKGCTLTARVLEQALLPPNAVQSLLPILLDVLLGLVSKKGSDEAADDMSLERLFRAIAGVVLKLNTTSDTLLQCLEVVQNNGKISLGSPARMECAHTLLQKGSMVVSQDPSAEKRAAWGKAEADFGELLQSF